MSVMSATCGQIQPQHARPLPNLTTARRVRGCLCMWDTTTQKHVSRLGPEKYVAESIAVAWIMELHCRIGWQRTASHICLCDNVSTSVLIFSIVKTIAVLCYTCTPQRVKKCGDHHNHRYSGTYHRIHAMGHRSSARWIQRCDAPLIVTRMPGKPPPRRQKGRWCAGKGGGCFGCFLTRIISVRETGSSSRRDQTGRGTGVAHPLLSEFGLGEIGMGGEEWTEEPDLLLCCWAKVTRRHAARRGHLGCD